MVVSKLPAQTWIETRVHVTEKSVTPRVNGWVSGNITPKLGLFAWFQVDKAYGESYGGMSFSPTPWLQFGVGGGIEQADNPARLGSFLWIGGKRQTVLAIYEHGGSGLWYKAEYNFALNDKVGVGLITERSKGTGPRLEMKIPRSPIIVWAAPLVNDGKIIGLIGVRLRL